MKLTFMIIAFLIVIFKSNANARALRRSCGKYLADRISDLCKVRGGYNQLSFTDSVQHTHNRTKRGIVEECCKQSCTDTTLIQYCMDQADVVQRAVVVDSNEETKFHTPAPTEKSFKKIIYTTRFPMHSIPMEIGTVRPEFSKINLKYLGNRRKHFYYVS